MRGRKKVELAWHETSTNSETLPLSWETRKLRIFRANVKSVLINPSETWKTNKTHTKNHNLAWKDNQRKFVDYHQGRIDRKNNVQKKWKWIPDTLRKPHSSITWWNAKHREREKQEDFETRGSVTSVKKSRERFGGTSNDQRQMEGPGRRI